MPGRHLSPGKACGDHNRPDWYTIRRANTLGQYDLYRGFLEGIAPERQIYLAVSSDAYITHFSQPAFQLIVERYQIPLLVIDVVKEEVLLWTK